MASARWAVDNMTRINISVHGDRNVAARRSAHAHAMFSEQSDAVWLALCTQDRQPCGPAVNAALSKDPEFTNITTSYI